METNPKKQLTATGLLCSLLITCTAGNLFAAERGQRPNEVSSNGNMGQTISQASFWTAAADLPNRSALAVESENTPVQTKWVLDDEPAVFTNGWTANTTDQAEERLGTRFAYAGGVGANASPTATATWEQVTVQRDGWYRICTCWTAHENRAPNAPYTIAWGDQSVTVAVNQQTNGGVWNQLQTIRLKAGDSLTVSLSNNADGYVIADGIQIEWLEDIILDDEDGVFTNGWAANTTDQLNERFGNRFAYAGGVGASASPTATATWEPVIIQRDGLYQIYACWTAHANRAPNAPYTIAWGDQSVTVTANQQTNGGVWNQLQTVRLKAGDSLTISLSNNADGYVVADGIRIEWLEDLADDRYTVTVETDEAGGTVEGKCTGLEAGETTTLTAIPKEGWHFVGWILDGETVCEETVYTLTVTGDLTLTAQFERIPVDKSELETVIASALTAQDEGLYAHAIPSMQRTFAELLEKAQQIGNSSEVLQGEVDEIAESLSKFLKQPILQAANKSALSEAIARAKQAEADGIYAQAILSVQQTFAKLLADAEEVYGQEDALQDEVDEICGELTAFLNSPILLNTDKTELAFVLDYATGLNLNNFAETGKEAFANALQAAQVVYGKGDADQETIDAALLELIYRTADLRIVAENDRIRKG